MINILTVARLFDWKTVETNTLTATLSYGGWSAC